MSLRFRLLAPTIALAASVVVLAVPRPAAAQPGMIAEPAYERHGLFAGGALWGGNISCEGSGCGSDFREAGGGSGHIGYLFGPNLGIILDFWGMTSKNNDVAITYVAGTLGARLWLVPQLWVQGGIGSGHAIVTVGPFAGRGDDVPVGELAIGLELVHNRNFALDVSLKVAQGTATDDNGNNVTTGRAAGLGISATWFASQPTYRQTYASR
jgi:hypothetical protein